MSEVKDGLKLILISSNDKLEILGIDGSVTVFI